MNFAYWLTQKAIAELFGTTISNDRGFLDSPNIELKEGSVCVNFAHTAYATDKDKVFGAVIYLNK